MQSSHKFWTSKPTEIDTIQGADKLKEVLMEGDFELLKQFSQVPLKKYEEDEKKKVIEVIEKHPQFKVEDDQITKIDKRQKLQHSTSTPVNFLACAMQTRNLTTKKAVEIIAETLEINVESIHTTTDNSDAEIIYT